MTSKRILVADCFQPELLPLMQKEGLPPIGETEVAMLNDLDSTLDCEICYAADVAQPLPDSKAIAKFDGMLWSGTPLSVLDSIPEVNRQIELMQSAFNAGIPIFGICGGLQVGVVAAGGKVIKNPVGLESPVARNIKLTQSGLDHAMFQFRKLSFDAFCDHFDMATELPEGAEMLAGNDIAQIQAIAFTIEQSEFWGVQYHPDFGLEHFRAMSAFRRDAWKENGLARDDEDVDNYTAMAKRLEENRDDHAAAWILGIGSDVLDINTRRSEVRAWLKEKIQ